MIDDEETIIELKKLIPDIILEIIPWKHNNIFREIIYEDKHLIIYNPHIINKQDLKERITEEIKKLKLN